MTYFIACFCIAIKVIDTGVVGSGLYVALANYASWASVSVFCKVKARHLSSQDRNAGTPS